MGLNLTYIMIVETFGNAGVVRVVLVIVVATILRIAGVQGLHTQRRLEELVGGLEGDDGVFGVEQVRCDGHGDWIVAAELVVGPLALLGSAVHVLVNATAVDDAGVDGVVDVLGGV